MSAKSLPDGYSWFARIVPLYLVLLPIALTVLFWFPEVVVPPRMLALFGTPAVMSWLLSQLGRDAGYRRQPALWEAWGGAPTIQLLRFRTVGGNPEAVARRHARIALLDPTLALPSQAEEEQNPAGADHRYEVATRFLISKTREKAHFPLLYAENRSYGFRRNLWGMKRFGLSVALAALASDVLRCWSLVRNQMPLDSASYFVAAVEIALILGWVFIVQSSWVRIPAQAYSERLLEAVDQLSPPAAT